MIARQKDSYDGAVPSGNSVAMLNLIRLARFTGDAELERSAEGIGRAFSAEIQRAPNGFTQMLLAADFAAGPVYEVVIAGDPRAEDTKEMLRALHAQFIPNKIVILRPTTETEPAITSSPSSQKHKAAWTEGQRRTCARIIPASFRRQSQGRCSNC